MLTLFSVEHASSHHKKASASLQLRSITPEEFQSMLDVTKEVVGPESAESWRFLLQGLWWSGLRLGEALSLTWHPSETLYLDFESGKYPLFRISGSAEKGGKDRLLPMAPEFAKFVKPMRQKTGFVFCPGRVWNGRTKNYQRNKQWISTVGCRIGQNADCLLYTSPSPRDRG